jgi:hypothetical protein
MSKRSHTRHSAERTPPGRRSSDRAARALRQHAVRRGTNRRIGRAPDMVLNHDPQRERPSDFCAGCVE